VTSWQELRDEAASCTRCEPYQRATQTVFGEGRTGASIALIGEQPGDQEDKQGHPFVGPAGRILDLALGETGIKGGGSLARAVARAGGRHHPPVRGTARTGSGKPGPAYTGLVADLVVAKEAAAEAAAR
jgi:uracil-DNA glycosylase